ncbi:MAG: cytochrome c oxidase subunit 3 [Planctomycetaceae bacterium]
MNPAIPAKSAQTPSQFIEAWKLGVKLMVGSLSIFFVAGIMGYVVILQRHITLRYSQNFEIPVTLWLSTIALLSVSIGLFYASKVVRRDKFQTLKRTLWVTITGAVLFTILQIVGMTSILNEHYLVKETATYSMSGIAFGLILFHAGHVAAGLVWLGIVLKRVMAQGYDHEYHLGLTLCSYYWHFLDFIWVVMLGVFIVTNMQ